jgi:hypothetical protein
MLVLFMLIGTAFLMTSTSTSENAKNSARNHRLGNNASPILERALIQLLRDSENPNSAIRYHSLLRDMYGTDGFVAEVYSPGAQNLSTPQGQVTRYAGAHPSLPADIDEIGPTRGQLIDIYVRQLPTQRNANGSYSGADDTLTIGVNDANAAPDTRHVLALDRDVYGRPQTFTLSLTRGYYNGRLLTMTSGPAAGQTTRIVDYEYIGDGPDQGNINSVTTRSRIFRFRVMAFPRAEGTPLEPRISLPAGHTMNSGVNNNRGFELFDLVTQELAATGQIRKRGGHTFVVNGPAFSGTGVGYNHYATGGHPRLSAFLLMVLQGGVGGGGAGRGQSLIGGELALLPNASYLDLREMQIWAPNPAVLGPNNLFNLCPPGGFQMSNNIRALTNLRANPPITDYPTYPGPGGASESYDAPDFQNMWLSSLTVTPRAQGRVVQGEADNPQTLSATDPRLDPTQFLRLDLEDLPWPSFHRPDLVNFWYHRLLILLQGPPFNMNPNLAVRAILDPATPGTPPAAAALIANVKRRIMMRPIREDHPNFDGGNPMSVPSGLPTTDLVRSGNIAIPYWEAVGPWDVDNDNDGAPDSVWVDAGDPILELEDGTRYKALYAYLVIDLDSRLNVNAHGLADHINPPSLAQSIDPTTGTPVVGTNAANLAGLYNSNGLPHGLGYGPAEISLRPVFPLPWNTTGPAVQIAGNRSEDTSGNGQRDVSDWAVDSYATLLAGRVGLAKGNIIGRHGLDPIVSDDRQPAGLFPPQLVFSAGPGISSIIPTLTVFGPPSVHAQLKLFDYPESLSNYVPTSVTYRINAFSTPPDLNSRYSFGLDHIGQPAYEFAAEPGDRPLVADSPYELDLSSPERRDTRSDQRLLRLNMGPGGWQTQYVEYENGTENVVSTVPGIVEDSDDAPFATADLERVLRAFDHDSGTIPSRLWDVVDPFDPAKLIRYDPYRTTSFANDLLDPVNRNISPPGPNGQASPELLAGAEQLSAVARRLVTTDSSDLPVPAANAPAYFFTAPPAVGANAPNPTAAANMKAAYEEYVRRNPPKSLVEMVELRIRRSFADASWPPTPFDDYNPNGDHDLDRTLNSADSDWTNAQEARQRRLRAERISAITSGGTWIDENDDPHVESGILAPELIAGQRLDLNRPFGDGHDNANDGMDNNNNGVIDEPSEPGDAFVNGVVDDPLEAGEPFLDVNGNGRWSQGEPFIDLLKTNAGGTTNTYDGPRDRLWAGLAAEPIAFDYTNGHGEPIREEVANGAGATARIRNLDSQARQLYARHLYCLMLLLVDEGYAETPNVPTLGGDNINLEFMLESIAARMNRPGAPVEDDKEVTIRKLTALRIAQWAINVADFRDTDSIMTAFEYDENPWDGWGTTDRDGLPIPLDGDVASNENGSELMAEVAGAAGGQTLAANNMAQVIDWTQVASTRNRVVSATEVTGPTSIRKQTRGVVWGVERPELLITETLAFHDRRATDENLDGSPKIDDFVAPGTPPDYDLDQRLKPRGSLFVELYNPWTKDGQKPGELYGQTQIPGNPPQSSEAGVMLNRLSDIGVQAQGTTPANPSTLQSITKRSPVWRLAVIRDPINGRLANRVLNLAPSATYDPTDGQAVQQEANRIIAQYGANIFAQVGEIDADGFDFDSDRAAERFVYFTTNGDPNRANDDNLENMAGQIGEYNFTVALGTPPIPLMNNLNVWVPPLPWRRDEITGQPTTVNTPAAKRYFIARTNRRNNALPNDMDVPIAPILPGRYAVIGSSGLQLVDSGALGFPPQATPDNQVTQRFVTPISRWPDGAQEPQSDIDHLAQLRSTRRIEFWPQVNPQVHQLLVASNGGPEFVRLDANPPINVHDPQLTGNPTTVPPASRPIDPCVVIPVEDLNISEPVEGYPSSHYQDLFYNHPAQPVAVNKANVQVNNQGELEFDVPYDHPLDLEFELVRNGTTQNYRSVHLQRLANPMLPWNPPPFDETGVENPFHQKHLPVNPYRTIDTQSVDLTAYNGATTKENELPSDQITNDGGLSDDIEADDITQGDYFAPVSLGEYRFAPDHVLRGLIQVLVRENIRPWLPVDQFRQLIKNDPTQVESLLAQLEQRRGDSSQDQSDRNWLTGSAGTSRVDQYGRNWAGQRGWSLLRRVLPEDPTTGQPQTGDVFVQRPLGHPRADAMYRQRLHMKSLERGSHNSTYYKWPLPSSFYSAYRIPQNAPEGWVYDLSFQPRLLWKRERPNVMLFLKGGATAPTTRAFDLENVLSRRQFLNQFNPDETRTTPDEQLRNRQIANTPGFQSEKLAFDFLLEQTLGFANEAFAPELDRADGSDSAALMGVNSPRRGAPEVTGQVPGKVPVLPAPAGVSPPEVEEYEVTPRRPSLLASPQMPAYKGITAGDRTFLTNQLTEIRRRITRSTYPWLAWNNRPFVGANELMHVPASPSSLMLRDYSAMSETNPYNGASSSAANRIAIQHAPFGHLLNFFSVTGVPANIGLNTPPGGTAPVIAVSGAPHYYRFLEYVHVPSRYVGTETMLPAETFNDNPTVTAAADDITGPGDPRYLLQPPFNKVSRQRDPGRVNLNTVTARRAVVNGVPIIWSEVFDGIMHRTQDRDVGQLGHGGPAWRDVVLSRKGYAQFNAGDPGLDDPLEKLNDDAYPDVFSMGLSPGFPTVFANPFRSPDAGFLVPVPQMRQYGVDASWLRSHPRNREDNDRWGNDNEDDGDGIDNNSDGQVDENLEPGDPYKNGIVDDPREAGLHEDEVSTRGPGPADYRAIPEQEFNQGDDRESMPLFSETTPASFIDAPRNSYMSHQPLSRMNNLVTNRSNVFAVWITVGYFELEPAPNWNDPNPQVRAQIRARFGATANDNDPATIAGLALYNRVYPDGYMLGREIGSDTGNTERHRGFYIVDRTQEVGFKPGEDLNVDKMIRLRRRIE